MAKAKAEQKNNEPDGLNNNQPETTTEVKVDANTLKSILNSIEDLKKSVKEKDDKIAMLMDVSDKARMARYESRNQGSLIRKAKVSFWNDMPIIGWHMVKDEVGFRDGKVIVDQQIGILVEDNATHEVSEKVLHYLYWAQNVRSEEGEVVEKTTSDSGEMWTVQMKDGRKYKIDLRFLNAF